MARKAEKSAAVAAPAATDKMAAIAALSAQLMPTAAPAADAIPADKKMVSRATFTGTLTFGLITMPVKGFTATEQDKVKFNQLHDACGSKLNQGKMHCPVCDCDVDADHIVKGHEVSKGKFVTVTKEELEGCEVASNPTMEVIEFVAASKIDPIYFESTGYLTPDKGGEKPFALLRAAMAAEGKVAIAQFAQRGRQYKVAVRPFGEDGMAISYLNYESEVRGCDKWVKVAVNDKELAVARQLINMLEVPEFNAEGVDQYVSNQRALVASKAAGQAAPVVAKVAAPAVSSDDLSALLAASIAATSSRPARVRKSA